MDDLHRDSHGSYGGRAPMDYGTGVGTGAGLLFAVIVLGAIVLATFFLGTGPGTPGGAVAPPANAPAVQN